MFIDNFSKLINIYFRKIIGTTVWNLENIGTVNNGAAYIIHNLNLRPYSHDYADISEG